MRNTTVDRVLGRRQRLADYLPAKYLRATDITAITAENIVLDAL